MGGEHTEKLLVEREYAGVMEHEHRLLNSRWWFGCIEEGVIKWLWGSFGVSLMRIYHLFDCLWCRIQLVLCAIPVFVKIPGVQAIDMGSRTEGFVTNRRLLLSSSGRFDTAEP